jgi:GT2 family glycosyltransferase
VAEPLRTPVVLVLFARPDTTERLVELVRAARPPLVFVIADGPRPDRPEDVGRCEATREVVARTDWDCEVRTAYADANLGVKRRVETGFEWVFEQVDEAIILEDDCIPHPTFFPFCDELLERYRDEPRIFSIAGGCFEPDRVVGPSYRFSRYQLIWGWATWRRAWRQYDPLLTRWPELRDTGGLEELLEDRRAVQFWSWAFEQAHSGHFSAWDWAWNLAVWLDGGLSVVPSRNLVANVGFREDATNTRPEHHRQEVTPPAVAMEFPLRHPSEIVRDADADRLVDEILFGGNIDRMFERLRARLAPTVRT